MDVKRLGLLYMVAVLMSGCFAGSGGPADSDGTGEGQGEDRGWTPGDEEVGEGSDWPLNLCGPSDAPAFPVTSRITNGDAWYQLYQFQSGAGSAANAPVFVSWGLDSHNLEPTHWGFSVWVWDDPRDPLHFGTNAISGTCFRIGEVSQNFSVHVGAGGGQWEDESACGLEPFSSVDDVGEAGFSFVFANQTSQGPFRWGAKPLCPDDGVRFWSETVFRDFPGPGLCVSCIIEELV